MTHTEYKIVLLFLFIIATMACSQPTRRQQADNESCMPRDELKENAAAPAPDTRPGAPSAAPAIGYGTAMADVARRFELFGRALVAERFELAEYQLGEIEEQFTETLPHASPPKEGHPEILPAVASAFIKTNIPDLRKAVATHDRQQTISAFERAAAECNACHQASGHSFIEVPSVPGRSIPNTDPIIPATP